jgi:hypothetical protein
MLNRQLLAALVVENEDMSEGHPLTEASPKQNIKVKKIKIKIFKAAAVYPRLRE